MGFLMVLLIFASHAVAEEEVFVCMYEWVFLFDCEDRSPISMWTWVHYDVLTMNKHCVHYNHN